MLKGAGGSLNLVILLDNLIIISGRFTFTISILLGYMMLLG